MDMQEPPMMGNQEPQGDMGNMGMGMDDDMNMDNNMNGDSPEKKDIQQLTGQLSQKLTDYNSNQPQKDSELNKYVANMIVKQAAKGMEQSDKSDVISKINDENSDDENQSQEPMDNQQNDMPMESVRRIAEKVVTEIFNNSLVDNRDKNDRKEKKITKPYRNLKSPFASNR